MTQTLMPDVNDEAVPVAPDLTGESVDVDEWPLRDDPGVWREVEKSLLGIDHSYQRVAVNLARVQRIALRFSWYKFGVLIVARRPDASLWVIDGQHRFLAALRRADVRRVGCLIHPSSGPGQEAEMFLAINTDRSPVQMIDRFRNMVTQGDPVAMHVKQMVEASGYVVARGNQDRTVQCAGVLYRIVRADEDCARRAWEAAVALFAGKTVVDRALLGLFTVERHLLRCQLGSLTGREFKPFVARLTVAAINTSIKETVAFHDKSGPKVFGEAILRLLNKGRRNKVRSLYSTEGDDGIV